MMVLDLTDNKRVDVELLERLIVEIERKLSSMTFSSSAETECSSDASKSNSASPLATTSSHLGFLESEITSARDTQFLLESLGKVLQQVCNLCYGFEFRVDKMEDGLEIWSPIVF